MVDWFGDFLKKQESGESVDLTESPLFNDIPDKSKQEKLTLKNDLTKEKNNDNKALEDLLKKLKEFRFTEAKKKNLPLYCVFANSVIDDIVTYLPTTKEDLIKIKGFGSKKIEQYGNEIINLTTTFLKENSDFKSKDIPNPTKLKHNKNKKIIFPKTEKKENDEKLFIEDEYFLKIKELIKNGENVFITGSAGTGKSFLLNHLKKEFNFEVTSTTGMAAVNVGGQTIHAWAGVGLCNLPSDYVIKSIIKKTHIAKRIRNTNILAIDEISMLGAQTFDYLNIVFKAIRSNNKPFGGIQLILFGDFFQLPPVEKIMDFVLSH